LICNDGESRLPRAMLQHDYDSGIIDIVTKANVSIYIIRKEICFTKLACNWLYTWCR